MTTHLVETARALAHHAHRDQRYGDQPYTVHLAQVAAVLVRHGLDEPALLAAAWLHDTIEDTPTTRADVASAAGEHVAAMVDAVTDGPGADRATRKQRPYRLIPQTQDAVLVKLADRIANVEAAVEVRPAILAKYQREHPHFRATLHRADDPRAAPLWTTLDALLS